ncbi:MAG: hypothetical protein M4579_001708 [Chaenotheca gracillima]|nr:MAG: hypothetical protein M4579_001708 [Chaenotheca gracillima]
MLHSAFWAHGAGDLVLPPWWNSSTAADCRKDVSKRPSRLKTHNAAHPSDGIFLDFLYPTRAVELIGRLSTSKGKRFSQSSPATYTPPTTYRSYTSHANSPQSVLIEDENVLDNASFTGQEHKPFDPPSATSKPVPRQGLELDDPDIQKAREALHELVYSNMLPRYERAWKLFVAGGAQDRHLILDYLSTSKDPTYAERSMQVFASMASEEKTSETHHYAYIAVLKLGDLEREQRIFEGITERNLQDDFGTGFKLAHAIVNEEWPTAAAAWSNLITKNERSTGSLEAGKHTVVQDEGEKRDRDDHEFGWEKPTQSESLSWTYVDAYALLSERTNTLFGMLDTASKDIDKVRTESPYPLEFFVDLARRALLQTSSADTIRSLLKQSSGVLENKQRFIESVLIPHLEKKEFMPAVTIYMHYRQEKDFKISLNSLRRLLLLFRTLRNLQGMRHVLKDWRHCHGTPDKQMLKISMAEFAEAGNADSVQTLFSEFYQAYGSELITKDLHPLLHVYARSGAVYEAADAFRKISKDFNLAPGIGAWRILIEAHVRAGDMDGALQCFDEMRYLSDMVPDRWIITALMQMHADRGDVESVEDLFDYALKHHRVKAASYCDCLVQAHINNEDIQRAESVAEEVSSIHFRGSHTPMWNHLLAVNAFRGNVPETQRLYQRMVQGRLRFEPMTFAALMQSLVSVGEVDSAQRIMDEILPQHGMKPSAVHYAIVMSAYARQGATDKIHELYSRMQRGKVSFTLQENPQLIRRNSKKTSQNNSRQASTEEEILDWLLRKTHVEESISRFTLRGFSRQEVSRAFPTFYLDFLLHMVKPEVALGKAVQLYERCRALRPRQNTDHIASLALKVSTSLMVREYRHGNFEKIAEIWDLIRNEHAKQTREWYSVDTDQTDWVLPRHRYILNIPLQYYIRSLSHSESLDEVEKARLLHTVVNDLRRDGFQLDNRSWNLYIQSVALYGENCDPEEFTDPRMDALELCELYLMEGWRGWDSAREQPLRGIRDKIDRPDGPPISRDSWDNEHSEQDPLVNMVHSRSMVQSRRPTFLRPIKPTIAVLARVAHSIKLEDDEAREVGVLARRKRSLLEQISQKYPRTMHMLRRMPRSYMEGEMRLSV